MRKLQLHNKVLVTYPRGSGKSFNMSVIKAFYEMELDPLGRPLPEDLCINKKLFETGGFDSNGCNAGMKIMAEEEIVAKHFGKYIVLKLDLQNVEGNYEQLFRSLSQRIADLYRSFRFLQLLARYSNEKDNIEMGINCANQPISAHSVEFLKSSLQVLSEIIHQVYYKQTIILVDDFDHPTRNIHQHINDTSEREKAVSLFRCMTFFLK